MGTVTGIAVGATTGVAAGGYFAYEAQTEFEATHARALSQFYNDPDSVEVNELNHAYWERNVNVVTLPMGYGLAGAVSGRLSFIKLLVPNLR